MKTSLFEMPGSGAIEKCVMTKLYFWRIIFFDEVEYRTFEAFHMDFDPLTRCSHWFFLIWCFLLSTTLVPLTVVHLQPSSEYNRSLAVWTLQEPWNHFFVKAALFFFLKSTKSYDLNPFVYVIENKFQGCTSP
jgi:hypothetical protein